MAGTARGVQQHWGNEQDRDNFLKQDAAQTLFDEHDKIITDLETLRFPSVANRLAYPNTVPQFTQSGTDSDLDIDSFVLVNSDGILEAYKQRTVTTIVTLTVTADTYGAIVWQAKNDGTITQQTPAAASDYTTLQLALTAALALAAATDTVIFAISLIEADTGDWVANTDDFTSDLEGFGTITLGGASVLASALTAATVATGG